MSVSNEIEESCCSPMSSFAEVGICTLTFVEGDSSLSTVRSTEELSCANASEIVETCCRLCSFSNNNLTKVNFAIRCNDTTNTTEVKVLSWSTGNQTIIFRWFYNNNRFCCVSEGCTSTLSPRPNSLPSPTKSLALGVSAEPVSFPCS